MTTGQPCPFGDPYCPCQDGDACHYVSLPGSPAMTPPRNTFDRMRAALGQCTFLPASSDKRFARSVATMPADKITERQKRHVIRLAWKYRRQMPADLVPSKDAVRAMDAGDKP